jgi:hypothetical protein
MQIYRPENCDERSRGASVAHNLYSVLLWRALNGCERRSQKRFILWVYEFENCDERSRGVSVAHNLYSVLLW